jgi:hypothetical protein
VFCENGGSWTLSLTLIAIVKKTLRTGGGRLEDSTPQENLAGVLGFGSSVSERASSPFCHGACLDKLISFHAGLCRTSWWKLKEEQQHILGSPCNHLCKVDYEPVHSEVLGGPDAIPPLTVNSMVFAHWPVWVCTLIVECAVSNILMLVAEGKGLGRPSLGADSPGTAGRGKFSDAFFHSLSCLLLLVPWKIHCSS